MKIKKCPHCGRANIITATQCKYCGKLLEDESNDNESEPDVIDTKVNNDQPIKWWKVLVVIGCVIYFLYKCTD